jgi:transcriptional regulator GlxA family with amidase domain
MAAPHVVEQVEQRMQTRPRRPVADTGWGECVEMLLRQSQGRQITLEDIARRIDVSARTIDRCLKREGLQFRALSQRVRFERARELLAVHGASVSWVADQLGFTDAANFSRGFRRHCGVTPSEFLRAVDRRRG